MDWTPDSQPRDPYGWATNQAGHAAIIGIPAALILLPWLHWAVVPVVVALVYGIAWEVLFQGGLDWRDSLMDTACVMAGASTICGALGAGYWTAVGCIAAWGVVLALGWRQRA